MKPRILVIRGGAIGDFILTLPALRLLRDNFPQAHIEILGYKHIIALAEGRFYADASRSIEYGPLARFFVPGEELDPELAEYFAGFQQVISYLFDPDGFFEGNLRRAGVKHLLCATGKLDDSNHAAQQLARPLESLALYLEETAAEFFPSVEDRAFARTFLRTAAHPVIAFHPGSGSIRKNWPIARWHALVRALRDAHPDATFVLIGGEADDEALQSFRDEVSMLRACGLPLYQLGAVLARCDLFVGHDSGVSHLAAAAGVGSVLLFGPTDPDIWAPRNPGVKVLRAEDAKMDGLSVEMVLHAVEERLRG